MGKPGVQILIVGPSDGSTVMVKALAPGEIRLKKAQVNCVPEGCGSCTMTILAQDPTPVERTTWGAVKSMYR